MTIEAKHLALLQAASQRGITETTGIRLCFELLSVASAIDRDCGTRLSKHRLSEGKFVLLSLLQSKPEGLSPHELAEAAGVTRATITGLLDGMERDGFIKRNHDTVDRRKIIVCLTAEGAAVEQVLFHEHSNWISSLLDGFSRDEQQILSRLLMRIWRKTDAGSVKLANEIEEF